MKIISLDKQSVINIEYVESEMYRYPCLSVTVNVDDRGFSGCNMSIWIELEAFRRFINQLEEVDQHRHGKAEIQGMSPDTLSIKIYSVDKAGHLIVEYSLAQITHVGPHREWISKSVSGGFELDTTMFTQMVKQMAGILKECES
jgi:hypothetical protein